MNILNNLSRASMLKIPNYFHQAWLFLCLFGMSFLAFAEQKVESIPKTGLMASASEPSDYFGKIMLSLVFILLIIFVSAWLIKRFGSFTGVPNLNMKILGALSVGQKERIVLLQVGNDQLVIGVTPAEITLLHQLSEPVGLAPDTQPETIKGAFAQRLQEALGQRNITKGQSKGQSNAGSQHES